MKRVLIFLPDSKQGGPYVSHLRIMNSCLKSKYEFVPFYYPRIRKMLTPSFKKEVKTVIDNTNPDIVHCVGLQIDGYLQVQSVRSISKKSKILLAVHGSHTEVQNPSWWLKIITDILEKRQLRLCDKYYGVSNYTLSMNILSSFRNKSLGVVYNLPDYNRCFYDRDELRNKLGLRHDDIVVVSTGRITEDKGYDELTDIILRNKNDRLVFLIVGDGAYLPEMKKRLQQSSARTIFPGYVEDVYKYLTVSDIFIICTKHETLCNSIIEAGSAGLPVIATRVGGIPEIISDGENGYLYNSGETENALKIIDSLVSSKESRNRLGNCLKTKIEDTFSEKIISEAIDRIYCSL